MNILYWLTWGGRLSRSQYVRFLVSYTCAFLPVAALLFSSFVIIGSRAPEGIINRFTLNQITWVSAIFGLFCLWPLIMATIRRLHDLGYRSRDVFFTIDPRKNWRLGWRLIREEGQAGQNRHGDDPTVPRFRP